MGEQFDLLVEAIVMERLYRLLDDPGMKLAAAILQYAAVRDLLRERVFEAVFQVWKQGSSLE